MNRNKRRRGFTLVELMVVITIIGILASIVGVNVYRYLREAKVTSARAELRNLKMAVDSFYHSKRRLPDSLEELTQGGEDERFWDGEEIPKDPWDGEYGYEKTDKRHYDIWTWGADGVEGGEGEDADIHLKDLSKRPGEEK